MVKLNCGASELKNDRYQFRADRPEGVYCDLCQNFAKEGIEHVIMHCPFLDNIRINMYSDIESLEIEFHTRVMNIGHVLLGKMPEDAHPEFVHKLLKIVSDNVYRMYMIVIKNRVGVG